MSIEQVRASDDERVVPSSMAEVAYQRIKDQLIMLDIRPGDPLNDLALAAELGIGRTPIREALKRLETDHLVVSYNRRGTFATIVDFAELGSISDIRQLLEPHAARRAAENASPQLRAQMRARAEEVRHLEIIDGDRRAFIAEDMAVHKLIYRATGNPHLEDVLTRYDNLATRIWCLVIDRLPDLSEHVREHASLLEAIADGDVAEAVRLTSEHVGHFDRAVRVRALRGLKEL